MGCPDIYYKQALQYLAYNLTCHNNMNFARELLEEDSEEKLEQFLLSSKAETEDKQFYFNAGIAFNEVYTEAVSECTDALNAAIGGLSEFEYFIGLRDDDD